MEISRRTKIILGSIFSTLALLLLCAFFYYFRKKIKAKRSNTYSLETGEAAKSIEKRQLEAEQLIKFASGEKLTANDILEAPGEVVGKSSYGTLYRACIQGSNSVVLLRFVRPACAGWTDEIMPVVRVLGSVRHDNLVSLRALYVGPRGEKLFVHPFFAAGNLAEFLQGGVAEAYRWDIIYKLSCGIAKGLDHLHTGLEKPIIHGNLKSNNVLLDADYQPRLSDFGLHLILNPTAAQEMLEVSTSQGYKAPELMKMKDATKETDIYSLGVVLLEMLTQKDPTSSNILNSNDIHMPTSLRNLVLEHKVSEVLNSQLLNQSMSRNSANEEGLIMLFQLAMACCSPSPALRPDIKQVIRKLEEIRR